MPGSYMVRESGRIFLRCEALFLTLFQTTSNACASIALLNIVMNIEGIELGPTLESLKAFTTEMDPAICGYIVSNHDYIRQIHNSFSR